MPLKQIWKLYLKVFAAPGLPARIRDTLSAEPRTWETIVWRIPAGFEQESQTAPQIGQFFLGNQGPVPPAIVSLRRGVREPCRGLIGTLFTKQPARRTFQNLRQTPQIPAFSHVSPLPPIADGRRLHSNFLGDLVVLKISPRQCRLKSLRKKS
jgi:hypothetical protein